MDTAKRQAIRAVFTDPVSNAECELVIPPGGRVYPRPGEAKTGVAHPGCPAIADLEIWLDAFWCPACRWNGRISGAWCADLIRAAGQAVLGATALQPEGDGRQDRAFVIADEDVAFVDPDGGADLDSWDW